MGYEDLIKAVSNVEKFLDCMKTISIALLQDICSLKANWALQPYVEGLNPLFVFMQLLCSNDRLDILSTVKDTDNFNSLRFMVHLVIHNIIVN